MAKITVHYLLSTVGQKAAILAGVNAADQQTVQTEATAEWLALDDRIYVTSKGEASAAIGCSCPGVKLPLHPEYEKAYDGGETTRFDSIQTAESLLAWEKARRATWPAKREAYLAAKKAEADAKEAKHRAAAERWAALPLEWRADGTTLAMCRPANTEESYRGQLFTSGWGIVALNDLDRYTPDAVAEVKAEIERRKAERKAEAERKIEAERARIARWAAEHGSQRLQMCLAEGYECHAIYHDEYAKWLGDALRDEHPDWRLQSEIVGEVGGPPRNPPVIYLELLTEARRDFPKAELVYWTIDHQHDWLDPDESECTSQDEEGDCPVYDWTGYMVRAEWANPEDRTVSIPVFLGAPHAAE